MNDVFENCKDTASFEEQRKQGLGMLKFYARLAEKIGNQMNDSHEYVLYGKFGALSGYTLDHLLRPVRTENVSQRQYSQRYKAELRKVSLFEYITLRNNLKQMTGNDDLMSLRIHF